VATHYFRFTHRGAGNRQRARLLERLLARADAPTVVTDWRADAYRVIAPKSAARPALGATALCAERGLVDAAAVFFATPVHYIAEMSNVRLASDGILSLSRPEADALVADFNRVWQDAGIRLIAGRPQAPGGARPMPGAEGPTPSGDGPTSSGEGPGLGPTHLFCVTDRVLDAETRDPEDVLDQHIADYLPAGADAPRLRQLMSEIEMWLFEHTLNRTRIANAAPAVNGLWLWGGGPALASLPPVEGWTAGADVFFKAFGVRPELPSAANTVSGASANSGGTATSRAAPTSGVVVIDEEPGSDAWRDTESRWLERSLEELNSGRISRLDLSAGGRCFSVTGRWNRRPWRRRRPWWEVFA
jgi:hypothetical protein